jgi:3-ketosteroid 9alpha-monooxygenase subunit A
VYIGRRPTRNPERAETKAREFGQEVIRQFAQDIDIWRYQRYSDPPALAGSEQEGFTALRNWAKQFYPDGIGGSAAEVYAAQKGRTE